MNEEAMQEQVYEEQPAPRWWLWGGVGLIGFVILILLLVILAGGRERPLKSLTDPTPTVAADLVRVDNQPLLVTFDQLNENPYDFLNRTIRVSGDYVPVQPPGCTPHNGPHIDWALVSDNLQLDVKGYRLVRRLVAEGQPLTVEGIWRLYEGPLGCGKEPETDVAWYLAVTQILQPNPLPNAGNVIASGGVNAITTPLPQGAPIATRPAGTVIPTPTPTATPRSTASATPSPSPTASQAAIGATTTTGATTTATPTETLQPGTTRRPTNTPSPSTTATATQTPTPTLTGTPATATPQPTQPSLPTSTPDPDGYPGPDDTPTPGSGYP